MNLQEEITAVLDKCVNQQEAAEYSERLKEGLLTRDENIHSHFCAYFLPYNPENGTLLIGAHKKSGLWLVPGGHIDKSEGLLETVNREIHEELGVTDFFTEKPEPFLLTITNIVNDVRPCKKHFDVWHVVETDGKDFEIDHTEYHEVRWVTISQARELIEDPANLKALSALELLKQD